MKIYIIIQKFKNITSFDVRGKGGINETSENRNNKIQRGREVRFNSE